MPVGPAEVELGKPYGAEDVEKPLVLDGNGVTVELGAVETAEIVPTVPLGPAVVELGKP